MSSVTVNPLFDGATSIELNAFGRPVLYTCASPAGNPSPFMLTGILRRGQLAEDEEKGTFGTLFLRLSDFPQGRYPEKGDSCTVDGIAFKVTYVPNPDEAGCIQINLRKS